MYGGYADPVRGKLVAEYEMLTDTWGNWGTAQDMGDGTTLRYKRFTNPVYGNSINNHHTDYCNVTKYNYTNENGNPHYYIVGQSYNCRVYMPNDFSTDQVIQVIGKLITPIEYDIDPITLQTFLDYNNFWTDMNDDTEVEYAFADRLSERKLIMDTPHIASAQGLVASFNTDLKAPIVDLKAYFTPVQEGTGDPSPQNKRPIHGWTGLNIRREGKNLIDKNSLVGTDKVWWKGKVIGGYPNHYATPMIPVKPGGTYYLNRDSGSQDYVCFFDKDGEYIEQQVWNTYSKTKTLGENVYYIGITIAPDYINSALLQFDSANTSYADYIDGAVIPIEFPATRNLLDTSTHETSTHIIKSGITFDYNSNGTLTVNGQVDSGATTGPQYRMALWTQQETGDYYLCCGAPYSAVYNEAYVYDSELSERPKKWDGVTQSQSAESNRPLSEVHLIAGHTYSINIRINRGQDKAYANDEFYVMLLRSTDTDTHYEPYGTIYGGYIDLIRGKIVNTYKKVRLDSFASSWYEESGPSGFFVLQYKIVFADRDKFVCNAYKPVSLPYWNSMPDLSIMGHPTMDDLLRIRDTSYAGDTAGFVANLTNIGAELAYPISTPIEYDLTPETLKSFIGQNNIWADTNGNVDVKYWTH